LHSGFRLQIDPQNYEAVRQYLEAVFQEAISELKAQNDELATRVQSKVAQDAKLEEERAGLEKEIALKQVRQRLAADPMRAGCPCRRRWTQPRKRCPGWAPRTPFCASSCCSSDWSAASRRAARRLPTRPWLPPVCRACRPTTSTGESAAGLSVAVEGILGGCRRQITVLTAAIEGNDAILAQKRRELQELHERREQERDAGAARTRELDARIGAAQRAVDELTRQLAQLDADSREAVELRAKLERLQQTERQLGEGVRKLEAQLTEADQRQLALSAEAKQRLAECEALRQRLRDEDLRRDTLEEKLQVRPGSRAGNSERLRFRRLGSAWPTRTGSWRSRKSARTSSRGRWARAPARWNADDAFPSTAHIGDSRSDSHILHSV